MAFKTDILKLKVEGSNPGTGANGELAIVGTSGNLALKYYDEDGSGSWKAVDSSSSLAVSNFGSGIVETANQFTDSDTKIMTSAAIQDKIAADISAQHTANMLFSLSANVVIGTSLVSKYVVMDNPGSYKFTLTASTTANGWKRGTSIEIINLSNYTQTISRPGSDAGKFYFTNTRETLTAGNDISIGKGQRAIILPDPDETQGQPLHFITILSI